MRHLKKSKTDLYGLKPNALRVRWSIEVGNGVTAGFDGAFDSRLVPEAKRAQAQEIIEQAMAATMETIVSRLQRLIVER